MIRGSKVSKKVRRGKGSKEERGGGDRVGTERREGDKGMEGGRM